MSQYHDFTAEDRRRQERRIWRTGLWLSLLVHVLIFLVSRGTVIPLSPFAAAGPRAGDNRAASGSLQAINIRTPPSVPIVPPPAAVANAIYDAIGVRMNELPMSPGRVVEALSKKEAGGK